MKEFHHAKIVTGKCPECGELTILVFLADDFYRCVNCGADLEQHVNGVISYIPHIHKETPKSKVDEYFNGQES